MLVEVIKNIIELNYNYRQVCSDGREVFAEDFETAKVGERGCKEIVEHPSAGEGDRWFYDIYYADGIIIRTFNPCKVIFETLPIFIP